jgi:hypothetical protein
VGVGSIATEELLEEQLADVTILGGCFGKQTARKHRDTGRWVVSQDTEGEGIEFAGGCSEEDEEAAAVELRVAAQKGDCGKLRELLECGGASIVNERTEGTDMETGKLTALHQAVVCNQHAAVELLLEHSANPNLEANNGETPLNVAAGHGNLHVLRTLLDQKAIAVDHENRPDSGVTAFHLACEYNHIDCAVELVRHGCDTELVDCDDQTGWDNAKCNGYTALIRRCKGAQKLARRKAQQHEEVVVFSKTPSDGHHNRLRCQHPCCDTRTVGGNILPDGVFRKFSFYPDGGDAREKVERMNLDPVAPPENTVEQHELVWAWVQSGAFH